MTDQIRRASISVATNIGEGYRKKRYPKMFVAKMADADGEATETQVWLEFTARLTPQPGKIRSTNQRETTLTKFAPFEFVLVRAISWIVLFCQTVLKKQEVAPLPRRVLWIPLEKT